MRKSWIAGLALALATASPAFAKGHGHHNGGGGGGGWDSFSNSTLQGTYIFEASGFDNNDTGDKDNGEVGILGVLTLDGGGNISGNLTLTSADSAGEQENCTATISPAPPAPGSNYSIPGTNTAPGLGTLALVLNGTGNAGTINFQMIVPSPNGKSAQLLESDTSLSGVQMCGQNINAMMLKAHLKRVDEGQDD